MSGFSQVFHHVPKPISVNEFRDAVMSICTPRYPMARQANLQTIALAVSGGVDSMALAYLMAKLNKTYSFMKIADNPLNTSVMGIHVDHRLRPESEEESRKVHEMLRKMGVKPLSLVLKWQRMGLDPNQMANVESMARTLRYRTMAERCASMHISSLFVAHHEDDQHETVLMRMLSGHGYRGLLGIRPANDIPECEDIYGAYKSGLLDNLARVQPSLRFRPSRGHLKLLKGDLLVDAYRDHWSHVKASVGGELKLNRRTRADRDRETSDGPSLPPVDCEEGGIIIYRPLLEFSKDRLRATCEANQVPWVEDSTNRDQTMTTRNAVRHMIAHCRLPTALRKPAILALSRRCRRRTNFEDAEAQRLLVSEAAIRIFDPHVGTVLVDLPTFGGSPSVRQRSLTRLRDKARRQRRRVIAAILIRKLTDFVTPDSDLPALPTLEKFVPVLFPELADEASAGGPKAFSVAGTFFQPVPGATSNVWFLSRAPFGSGRRPLPEDRLGAWCGRRLATNPHQTDGQPGTRSSWYGYPEMRSWDGRFWIKFACTDRDKTWAVRPLQPEYLADFKKTLGREERNRLEEALRYYAPGKVRYTLPAFYGYKPGESHRQVHEFDMTKAELYALPSLGFSRPGLQDELRWTVRYKRVDSKLLGLRKRTDHAHTVAYKPNVSVSRQLRNRRLAKSRAWRQDRLALKSVDEYK